MRVLMPFFLAAVFGLAGCVPVPLPYDFGFYAPNGSDVTVSQSNAGGTICAINESTPAPRGSRTIGDMKAIVGFDTIDEKGPNPKGQLYLDFGSIKKSDTVVAINPALITLEERGRALKVASSNDPAPGNSVNGRFVFPPPSGVSTNIRVVFELGAIKFDGQPIPFEPIRFSNSKAIVYFFPCIPS